MEAHHILVATDLSLAADEALRQAHDRAREWHAQLLVCHVVPSPGPLDPLFPAWALVEDLRFPQLRQRLFDTVTARVSEVTGATPGTFGVLIEEGTPYAGIIRRAEAWGADLLVIGSHGATGGERTHLGRVAQRVVRHAHCPVLVARPGQGSGQVVVGTDFSESALPAVAAAVAEARRVQGQLTIVHSAEVHPAHAYYTSIGVGELVVEPEQTAESEAAIDQHLAAALQRCGAEGVRRVCWGPAAAALALTAAEIHADLLVVGTAGRTGLSRVLLGSVAEAVVVSAPCSVLVVRAAA